MCGIFGFTNWNSQTDRLFATLADEMESRGGSSWGASNGTTFIKRLGAITRTIDNGFRGWDDKYGLIFHTRAPSSGTGRAVEDAHPFIFSRELSNLNNTVPDSILSLRVTGIHNGYVAAHNTLKTKYPERKEFSVDSMHLFKHICDGNPIEEITGSGAIAWFETICREYFDNNIDNEYLSSRLFIARFDTDALHIGKLDTGEMVFASTKEAIEKAARLSDVNVTDYLTIKARTKYELVKNADGVASLVELEEMKFGTTSNCYGGGVINGTYHAPGATGPNFPQGQQGNHGYWKGNGANSNANSNANFALVPSSEFFMCPGCSTAIDPTVAAICDDCLSAWVGSYVNIN